MDYDLKKANERIVELESFIRDLKRAMSNSYSTSYTTCSKCSKPTERRYICCNYGYGGE